MKKIKIKKIALITLAIIIGLIGISWIVGMVKSPGITPPIVDSKGKAIPNSVASWEKVIVGGIEQWILVRGNNIDNPVLLFLHGGPGSPEMPMVRTFNKKLEEHFVVVNWDQRGSGKSFNKAIPLQSFTIDQFVTDTHELVELLRKRFKKEKIYLMGHSWGTVVGVMAVKKNPEPFYAYIGIGQVANMSEGERISYEFVLNTAKRTNNQDAIRELTEIGPPPYQNEKWMDHLLKERNWVTEFGGAWQDNPNVMYDMVKLLINNQEYTVSDKVNYLRGSLQTIELMWSELMQVDLLENAYKLEVPVYIFQGEHDYQTPYVLAKQYYQKLEAPRKKLFTFKKAAHSPIYENPQLFYQLLMTQVMPETK